MSLKVLALFCRTVLINKIIAWAVNILGRRLGHLGHYSRVHRVHHYYGIAAVFLISIGLNAAWLSLHPELGSQSQDLAIKWRLSSPPPDPKIIILDIDERTLALLSTEYGRWPWPRSVLAEAIATLSDFGAKAIAFNIMMSDSDKFNLQSDAIFNDVAKNTLNAVFPLIRLNAKNDQESQVQAKMLPSVRFDDPTVEDSTIAVLFPYFTGTHDKLGVINLKVDQDGAVRRFSVWWQEKGFALPSMALRSALIDNANAAEGIPDEILLNWRNKRGDYTRVSFADYYQAINGVSEFSLSIFKNATVVIGVSAPGIATTKGTSSSPLMDDNVIMATAIDDIQSHSYLRILPAWATSLVTSILVLGLAFSFAMDFPAKTTKSLFTVAQSSLAIITIVSASYTFFLVDLSESFLIGFLYFLFAKAHSMVSHYAEQGMPMFSLLDSDSGRVDSLLVFGFESKIRTARKLRKTLLALENHFGVKNIFLMDNAFGSQNLFGRAYKDLTFFVVFSSEIESSLMLKNEISKKSPFSEISAAAWLSGSSISVRLEKDIFNDRLKLEREVGRLILSVAGNLINRNSPN